MLLNGSITYDRSNSPIDVGTVATHTCDDMFVPSKNDTRTCTNTDNGGVWSGSAITCLGE